MTALALGGGGETVHGAVRKARFEAGAAGIPVDKLVGVGQLKAPVADAVHPDGRIVFDEFVVDKST